MDTLFLTTSPTPKLYGQTKPLAAKKSPPYPSDANKALKNIESAFISCRMQEALELLMHSVTPEQQPLFGDIIKSAALFTAAGLSDGEAEQLQQLAFGLLQKNQLTITHCQITVADDFVHYEIFVDLAIGQLSELDFTLAQTLANLEDMRDDVLIFEYRSAAALA